MAPKQMTLAARSASIRWMPKLSPKRMNAPPIKKVNDACSLNAYLCGGKPSATNCARYAKTPLSPVKGRCSGLYCQTTSSVMSANANGGSAKK